MYRLFCAQNPKMRKFLIFLIVIIIAGVCAYEMFKKQAVEHHNNQLKADTATYNHYELSADSIHPADSLHSKITKQTSKR